MKLRLLATVVLIGTLTICCVRIDLIDKYSPYSIQALAETFPKNTNKPFNVKVDNQTPYSELITREIDLHGPVRYLFHSFFGPMTVSLKQVSDTINVECLRQPEDIYMYSVHETKQGGLLYIFYANYYENIESASVTSCFYVEKELCMNDFANIEQGSTFYDIALIDPSVLLYQNLYYTDTEYFDATGFGSLHYLNGGILQIAYHTENGIKKVSNMHFDEKYSMYGNTGRAPVFSAKILDIDRIHQS